MKFQITIFQIISICVVIGVSLLIYFLTKPSDSTTSTTTDDSVSVAKKFFLDEPLKNTLGMSNGYKANKENNFNAIDTAFKEDILKSCKCMVDFIKQNSGKTESEIILFTQADFMQTILSIVLSLSISFPNCQSNTRQLNFLINFLTEGRCYPNINELITWIKKHINNTYRADEIIISGKNSNYKIVLSTNELDFYTIFLTSHSCCTGSTSLLCGTDCVDPNTNSSNCGACGNVCPSGKTCSGGKCN